MIILDQNTKNTIIARYRNGDTMQQISKAIGIGYYKVSRWLHECGEFTAEDFEANSHGPCKQTLTNDDLVLERATIHVRVDLKETTKRMLKKMAVNHACTLGEACEIFTTVGHTSWADFLAGARDRGLPQHKVIDLAKDLRGLLEAA